MSKNEESVKESVQNTIFRTFYVLSTLQGVKFHKKCKEVLLCLGQSGKFSSCLNPALMGVFHI